jgi:hypothetical protein
VATILAYREYKGIRWQKNVCTVHCPCEKIRRAEVTQVIDDQMQSSTLAWAPTLEFLKFSCDYLQTRLEISEVKLFSFAISQAFPLRAGITSQFEKIFEAWPFTTATR